MIKGKVEFDFDPVARCANLSKAVRQRIMRISLNKAAAQVKTEVVARAPAGRGNLKKSIIIKIANYRGRSGQDSSIWSAIIGASKKFKRSAGRGKTVESRRLLRDGVGKIVGSEKTGERGKAWLRPARYIHIVEGGSKFQKSTHFLRQSYIHSKSKFVTNFCQKFKELFDIEVAKKSK